jgi:hypothetical protein
MQYAVLLAVGNNMKCPARPRGHVESMGIIDGVPKCPTYIPCPPPPRPQLFICVCTSAMQGEEMCVHGYASIFVGSACSSGLDFQKIRSNRAADKPVSVVCMRVYCTGLALRRHEGMTSLQAGWSSVSLCDHIQCINIACNLAKLGVPVNLASFRRTRLG